MIEWLLQNEAVVWWAVGASAAMFVGTLIAVPLIVAFMPPDYFSEQRRPSDYLRQWPVAARVTVVVLKNVLGAVLVLIGIVMSVPPVPGQGLLTIVVGLGLLNFPGKRKLQQRIVRQKYVLRSINWMRSKVHRPPLTFGFQNGGERPGA
jgi:hypothetical protein